MVEKIHEVSGNTGETFLGYQKYNIEDIIILKVSKINKKKDLSHSKIIRTRRRACVKKSMTANDAK